MARTQADRRAETRARLLEAAAQLFAEQGIEAASVDAIAEAADRTSGSVYAHFGSKQGLLTALLDGWKNETAAVISAEFATTTTLAERLGVLWRNFARPSTDGRWVELEHELWLYATRHPEAREPLGERYQEARALIGEAIDDWAAQGEAAPAAAGEQVGALVIALLLGLEMQHRVAPDTVDEALALNGLRALLGVPATEEAPR